VCNVETGVFHYLLDILQVGELFLGYPYSNGWESTILWFQHYSLHLIHSNQTPRLSLMVLDGILQNLIFYELGFWHRDKFEL
jgi:hypothetical protein